MFLMRKHGVSGRVRLCGALARSLRLVWRIAGDIFNGIKYVVVEYWPTLLVTLSGAYCAVSLIRLFQQ